MRRIAVYLLVAAATVVIARAIAPVLIVAAMGLVVFAARWPARLSRLTSHPVLARIPARVRATPMRFAVAVAAASFVLVGASSALGPAETIGGEADEAASQVAAVTSPPAGTARPTKRPTSSPSPTPEPTPTATSVPTPPPTPTAAPTRALGLEPTGPIEIATVASVTDGDTIRVVLDGQNVPVRYIGIDTPEIHSGFEWMGPEAAAANERLVAGQQVVLEKDVSETDRYGRLLRYVWLDTNAAGCWSTWSCYDWAWPR